ncbi:MAG: hypothetical protein WA999_02690 [Spirulinaceae cyanobacterium]
MNNLPEPTESPPEADLEMIEDGLEEFRFEEWLEQKLFELDERHRRLEIKANTLINNRKSWLKNLQELFLPGLPK